MEKAKIVKHSMKYLIMIMVFLSLFISIDLYANETKTELDVNREVFVLQQTDIQDDTYYQYIGNALVKPVKKIKDTTETLLQMTNAIMTHDELTMSQHEKHVDLENINKGPKISLTF